MFLLLAHRVRFLTNAPFSSAHIVCPADSCKLDAFVLFAYPSMAFPRERNPFCMLESGNLSLFHVVSSPCGPCLPDAFSGDPGFLRPGHARQRRHDAKSSSASRQNMHVVTLFRISHRKLPYTVPLYKLRISDARTSSDTTVWVPTSKEATFCKFHRIQLFETS